MSKASVAWLMLACAPVAVGACPDKLSRDPSFVMLAVEEGAPRPKSLEDFKFINDTTTLADLTRTLGTPDGAKGAKTFVYCLADDVIVTVATRDGTDIKEVRSGWTLIYKRK